MEKQGYRLLTVAEIENRGHLRDGAMSVLDGAGKWYIARLSDGRMKGRGYQYEVDIGTEEHERTDHALMIMGKFVMIAYILNILRKN